ncbi:hypothetical protein QTH97_27235 [Variovorax sp. J22R24]|uniref:hypothetical protein n=1 Tax=Variovorax gracilis TaxID=3053502 RepID=UPI0025787DF3|nr:hypothetical protein [Variovorax sp. J22R24]MDM0108670.1 hypothetical protein [Variovorax sp. J22R24]
MTSPDCHRLDALLQRYAIGGDLPAGEAFQQAFRRFLKTNRESLLDLTVAAASAQLSLVDGPEDVDPLLLKAIHDTNPSIDENNLFGLDGPALQGAVNTAKGKYFEYLVVEKLNQGEQVGPLLLEPGQYAVLAESMTQPGWDMQIVDDRGDVVEYLQLKATDSVSYIRSALERYPDIEILATGEVGDSGLVLDSGITDHNLREHVELGLDAVDGSLVDSFLDHFHPLLPLAAIALYEGHRLSVGRQSMDAFKLALARRSQRIVVTQTVGAAVYALGGGLLSFPVAVAGGLVFDRTINQAALATSYRSHQGRLLALRLLQQERQMSKEHG